MFWTPIPIACLLAAAVWLPPTANSRVVVRSAPNAAVENAAAEDFAAEDFAVEDFAVEDFAAQGEYLGYLNGGAGRHRCGLQVVALGRGEFQALRFDGGLPGHGAVVLPGHPVRGRRDGGRVVLEDEEGTRVEITGGYADCSVAGGAGRLARFERTSPTLGLAPPSGAIVLFSEGAEPQFDKFRLADDGTLLAGATTRLAVGDFRLHVEFRTPYMPEARGQGRGNSGVYIQRRYELQILDSFGLAGTNNECGGLYKQQAPALNMCLPPLVWQTYDIQFRAARWNAEGVKTADAEITAFHNGVAVHYHRPIPAKTGAGQVEGPGALPIYFQDHGDPVTYRNVWIAIDEPRPIVEPCPPPSRRAPFAARPFRRR